MDCKKCRAPGMCICAPARPPMPLDRARQINDRLCNAYFAIQGLGDAAEPDLSDVSLNDAIEASAIMRAHPGDRTTDGKTVLTCSIGTDTNVAATLAANILRRAASL